MGNTPFRVREMVFDPEGFSAFIPVSAIAGAKRKALMLLEEKSRPDLLAGRRLEISDLSGEDPLKVLEKTHPEEKFITAATPLSEDTPLMTSRYCLKQALGTVPGKKEFRRKNGPNLYIW